MPSLIWAEEHAANPSADDGETAMPAGSVTAASCSGGVAIAASFPDCAYSCVGSATVSSFCGTETSTSSPVGVEGVDAVGCTEIAGSKWKRASSHPVICTGALCAETNAPGCCQESTWSCVEPSTPHCEGSVRNDRIGAPVNGLPRMSVSSVAVSLMRSASCAGSAGTPQNRMSAARSWKTSLVFLIVVTTE